MLPLPTMTTSTDSTTMFDATSMICKPISASSSASASSPASATCMSDMKPKTKKAKEAKEAKEAKKGAIRMICKARNMPPDHNADTAYFEVPADAVHGQILICSHPACIKSGRQFRYCTVCRLPVIKRNFRMRHSHGKVLDVLPDHNTTILPNKLSDILDGYGQKDTKDKRKTVSTVATARVTKKTKKVVKKSKKTKSRIAKKSKKTKTPPTNDPSDDARPSRSTPSRSCKRERRSYSCDEYDNQFEQDEPDQMKGDDSHVTTNEDEEAEFDIHNSGGELLSLPMHQQSLNAYHFAMVDETSPRGDTETRDWTLDCAEKMPMEMFADDDLSFSDAFDPIPVDTRQPIMSNAAQQQPQQHHVESFDALFHLSDKSLHDIVDDVFIVNEDELSSELGMCTGAIAAL